MFTTNTVLLLGGALGILYMIYRWALPKPIPGIPYNKEAVENLFGDIPNMLADMKKGGDVFSWVRDQNLKSGSAISQVFISPFGKPAVVLGDHREIRDLLLHRSQDFDRSFFVKDLFRPLAGNVQITLETGPRWKKTRRIAQDTMAPKFLNGVVAPNIYKSCLKFVELWNMKSQIANGRPFNAEADFFHTTLDGVIDFTFGTEFPYNAVGSQLQGLSDLSKAEFDTESGMDTPISFPEFGIGEELESMTKLIGQMDEVQKSGMPPLKWAYLKRTARYKKWQKTKDDCIRREVKIAAERLEQPSSVSTEAPARNALDLVVRRELALAQKENRPPNYFSEPIQSEIFGLVIGGHDTTSSTMCWAAKILADNQDCQTLLRQALQSAYSAAASENRQPTVEEIVSTSIPYLDATMEEIMRVGAVVPLNSRHVTQTTQLLGHVIPKGTLVLFVVKGPGTIMPAYKVDEKLRSESSRHDEKEGRFNEWSDDDIAVFKPERWLVEQSGSVAFDSNAGPTMPFGLGARSCFGRRLAYVSFRILLVTIIWNFELLECPEELSDYKGLFGVVYRPQKTYVRLRKVDHTALAAKSQ